mgnify:CR=1 FL=1
MDILTGLLTTAFLAGGVLALAALGEVLAERVGVVNLGVEGLMAMGAITGIATVTSVPSPMLGFLAALVVGALFGMLFAAATVLLRANQVLCGLALTLMGTGLASTIGRNYSGMPAPVTFEPVLALLSRNFGMLEKAQVIAAPPSAMLPYCSGQPQLIASGEW